MAKNSRYIEFCDTDGCRTRRVSTERSKGGYICYRCNRKKSRKPKQEAYAKAKAEATAPA